MIDESGSSEPSAINYQPPHRNSSLIVHPSSLAVLTGPTAVGKTEVAVEVAERLGVEIVCADSMQIYRRMEIGTAKPGLEQRARVPHHLCDFVDPTTDFTVADYRAAALPLLDRLTAEGRPPLVVGGTRLYLKSLTAPFATGPPPDRHFRAALAERASEDLHAELARVDPETAARLHPADRKRIVRALEVYHLSGEPISATQRRSQREPVPYEAFLVALVRDREEIYRRVDARVDTMIEAGLIDEVRAFLTEGLGPERISMQAHGYKEVMGYLLGQYDREEAIRLLKRNTRRYVKVQLVWLRSEPHVHWVRADRSVTEAADECVRLLKARH